MRRKVKDVFDDLQQCVEMRRQQVNDLIQAVEDKVVTSLTDLEKVRAVVTSHVGTIDHIVTSSPDDDLMLMSKQLMSRLNDLELQSGKTDKVKTVGDLSFDDQILTRLKSDLSALGKVASCRCCFEWQTKLSKRFPVSEQKFLTFCSHCESAPLLTYRFVCCSTFALHYIVISQQLAGKCLLQVHD